MSSALFDYAGKLIIPNGQIVNKQIKKMGPGLFLGSQYDIYR